MQKTKWFERSSPMTPYRRGKHKETGGSSEVRTVRKGKKRKKKGGYDW